MADRLARIDWWKIAERERQTFNVKLAGSNLDLRAARGFFPFLVSR